MENFIKKTFGYEFQNPEILSIALTHPSCNKKENYERLEFLGDKVIGLIIAKNLYRMYPNDFSGKLSIKINEITGMQNMANIAKNIDLKDHIKKHIKCTLSDRILSNAIESVIGAIYNDSNDMGVTEKAVLKIFKKSITDHKIAIKDEKSLLQEWTQKNGFQMPEYKMVDYNSDNTTICLQVKDMKIKITKSAKTKKLATLECAKEYIKTLKSKGKI